MDNVAIRENVTKNVTLQNLQHSGVEKTLLEQTDEELRHNIAQRQIKMQCGKATDDDRKQFDVILDEILRRRKERQNG